MATPELVAARSWPIVPCADRAGCRRIVSPGGPIDTNPFRVERGHGVHDGVRGLFMIFYDTSPYTNEWIVDDTGRALAGFRTRAITGGDSCTEGLGDVSATDFAFVLSRTLQPDGIADYLYRGAIGDAPTLVGDLRAPFLHGWTQELRIDTPRTAAWMSFQVVQAVEEDGSLSSITPGTGGGCDVADVVGDAIFVECSSPTGMFVQRPGGALTPMFASGTNFGLDSDGTDMVWARYVAQDGGYLTQLWTAPHTTEPSAIVERHLADVPPSTFTAPSDLRVGFGYAVLLEERERLGVYRLSDGARAQIDPPTGEHFGNAFVQYVGPEEIAVTSSVLAMRPADSQLMFIRLDSLTFVPP